MNPLQFQRPLSSEPHASGVHITGPHITGPCSIRHVQRGLRRGGRAAQAFRYALASCLLGVPLCQAALGEYPIFQPPAAPASESNSPATTADPLRKPLETWIGWIEAPETHLRWFVQFQKDSKGVLQGSSSTPEVQTKPTPFSKLEVANDAWKLEWTDPVTMQIWTYVGNQESANKVTGLLVIGPQTIAVPLVRAEQLPAESKETLGADIVWTDSQPSIGASSSANPFDFRFRFYTKPPYTEQKPRILVDSLAKNLIGKPVDFRRDEDGTLEFSIPSLQAEYRAVLASEDTMAGTFRRRELANPLEMKLWKPKGKTALSPKKEEAPQPTTNSQSKAEAAAAANTKKAEEDSVRITMDSARADTAARDLAPNESAFLLDIRDRKIRAGRKSDEPPAFLACTLTLPETTSSSPVPAVVLLSTYGPQDRDGTHGTYKPYRDLARWLANQGVASIRFDDRGVGGSAPPDSQFTPTKSIEDLQSVLAHLAKNPLIDAKKIGLLGHGEGAGTAVLASSTNPAISFLILLAPPGVSGSELLLSQSRKLAVLDGMAPKNQILMESIQRRIHTLARASLSEETAIDEVQQLVIKHWEDLKQSVEGEKTAAEWTQLRKDLESQLLSDYENLRSPWSKEFLFNEPAASWMLQRCPILAVWGEQDLQIVPEVNRPKIEEAVARGSAKSIRLEQVRGLNHWLQPAPNDSTREWEENTPISDDLLRVLESWIAIQL